MARRENPEIKRWLSSRDQSEEERADSGRELQERKKFRTWESQLEREIARRFANSRASRKKYLQKMADCLFEEDFRKLAVKLGVELS